MCLAAVTSFTVIEFLSLGFHHSQSTPTACFHFFVNFVRPQPPVCLWPKIKFPLGNTFPSPRGNIARPILETLKGNGSCFSFHHLNTIHLLSMRESWLQKDAHIILSWCKKGLMTPCKFTFQEDNKCHDIRHIWGESFHRSFTCFLATLTWAC